ncbi:MAG: alpha-E domain-containing protein, partial [Paracoccaceae bacterium]|nr:alpha-E domain-containing protein [Paracoccaceae bacterium]
ERASSMAWTLAIFADAALPEGALDLAVEVGDSLMTHRRRYAVATTRATVIDLLALDDHNPRSIFYQMEEVRAQVAMLPAGPDGGMTPVARRVLEVHTALAVTTPEALTTAALWRVRDGVLQAADLLAETYFG